ncbi:hypothetical protein [Sphingobium yanoikuyae]|uniref:hypothetical protein n=1 Tax=Sphingobium yanoikuyae TaxID=13690 RepID=UPI002FDA9418
MTTTVTGHPAGQVEVSIDTSFEYEGETFQRTRRYILTPDRNLNPPGANGAPWALEDEPDEVRAYCQAWWTAERLEAWTAHKTAPPE